MSSEDASNANNVQPIQSDLFYTEACNFHPDVSHLISWLKNRETLRPAVDAFQANLLRTWSMAILPQGVMHTSIIQDLMFCEATVNVLGRPFLQVGDKIEVLKEIAKEFDRLDANEEAPSKRAGLENQLVHLIHYHKRKLIPGLYAGFVALLGGQIINSLTAFETLAQDIWIAAVNERPKTVGSKENLTKKWRPSITMYQKFDFNLKHHMGDLIGDKIQWASFREMRDAYQLAFEDGPVSSIFDDSDLDVVNAIRNVLVHKAGIADKEFLDNLNVSQCFPTLKINEPVPLDGNQVRNLTLSTIRCGEQLIKFIDRWLDSHQE